MSKQHKIDKLSLKIKKMEYKILKKNIKLKNLKDKKNV